MGNAPSSDRRRSSSSTAGSTAARAARALQSPPQQWKWEMRGGRYEPVPRRQPSGKKRPLYKGFAKDNFEQFDAFHTYND